MIQLLNFTFTDLLNPEFYINHGGLWLILIIVFAETGLMIGFFLPGDSLLFVSGIYSSLLINNIFPGGSGFEFVDVIILFILISTSAILGSTAGYWFGNRSGKMLFERKDSIIFKRKHLLQAREFYDKHGGKAILFARFLPIIRTFATIVAGIVQMERKKFMHYNIMGAAAWVFSMLMGGHYLNIFFIKEYEIDLKNHLEFIIILIVLITTLPVLYKLFFQKKALL